MNNEKILELSRSLDNKTKEYNKTIISKRGVPLRLMIVKTDNSIGSNQYINSIMKKGKELNIETILVDQVDKNEIIELKADNVIVIKPDSTNKEAMSRYSYFKKIVSKHDIEGDAQYPTINAVINAIEKLGSNKHVTIINRTCDLGLPIAQKTLDMNHTVSVAHSKTPTNILIETLKKSDIIVTATNSNINPVVFFMTDKRQTIIDLSYDINKKDREALKDKNKTIINNIGRLTTSYLFNMIQI